MRGVATHNYRAFLFRCDSIETTFSAREGTKQGWALPTVGLFDLPARPAYQTSSTVLERMKFDAGVSTSPLSAIVNKSAVGSFDEEHAFNLGTAVRKDILQLTDGSCVWKIADPERVSGALRFPGRTSWYR